MSSKKLKVLHITPMYPSVERPAFGAFVKSQIDSLEGLVEIDLTILPGLGGILPYIKSIPLILKKLSNHYDVIHIHYGNVSSFVKLLYRGKTPIITSYCGDDLQGARLQNGRYQLKSLLYKRINSFLSAYDSYSIVKSKLLATRIEKRSKKIEVIPNGVNTSKFNEMDKKVARERIGIPADAGKVILFPADASRPGKNFRFLQKVLSRFDHKYKYTVITFKEGKVDPDTVPYYYYASDIVAFPSLSEGSPNVIKEAMACNSYILSSDCGDVSWLLKDVTGARILPLETGEWVQAFHEFFSGRNDGTSVNSREMLFKKELDTESIARRIVNLYNTLTIH